MKETKTKNTKERRTNSMKNKLLVLFGMLILVVAAYGCSTKKEEIEETTTQPETEEVVGLSSMIPNPEEYFGGELEVTTDYGEMYGVHIHGFEQSEFDAYVDSCISRGFSDIRYKDDDAYGANTSDGQYWVSVEVNDPIDPDEVIILLMVESEDETE